ncbi:MAG: hypothetical protein AAGF72_19755 [Pseudomonadota bacterium]
MSGDEKEEDMIYGLTADEHVALRDGLNRLPETMPPRIVWDRIREQAEAEGLLQQRKPQRHWYLGAGIAAALVMAVLVIPEQQPTEPAVADNSMTVPQTLPSNDNALTGLQALMVESRRLEADLRAIPAGPRVQKAGTAATIVELQDRIASIDYQLNDPASTLSPQEQETFWRERVRLMKSLVGLRYAQAQRTAL